MLVVSRDFGQSIVIGGGIKITFRKGKGGNVKLDIEAPHDVRVQRMEILENGGEEAAPVAA